MEIEKMKNQSFPEKHFLDWERKAEESLKGKPIDSLKTVTYENITLKPLYSKDDEKAGSEYPGGSDFRRGVNPLGYLNNKWKIAQRVSCQTSTELKEQLGQAFKRGQTALSFMPDTPLFEEPDSLADILNEYYSRYPFAIHAGRFQQEMLTVLFNMAERQQDREKVSGFIAEDPVSSFVLDGYLPEEPEKVFEKWAGTVKQANEQFPNLQTILINTTPYHNGGANAVQELGIAAATGVFYLQQLLNSELELEEALSKMIFHFSIGPNFFMEIAKLRAARIIWDKITAVFGAKGEQGGMEISAETSAFSKTLYDKHVNILRAGNEAFAAVIGGVQYLHVGPFDEITSSNPFSARIARNTQLILQEETHIDRTVDPAGGSWYIEELTRELSERAWKFFQEIEENGGMLEVLKSGWLQNEISAVLEKRNQDISSRKRSMIGTNVYANLEEAGLEEGEKNAQLSVPYTDGIKILPIHQVRLSMPYEGLRQKAEEVKARTGEAPAVGLICLGSLKSHKARADFMKGFLAAGGVEGIISESVISGDAAAEFVQSSNSVHFCLCGTNDQYEEMGHEILASLKARYPEKVFYLAGLPEQEKQSQWKQEGINQFIHVKSNCYETLSAILSDLGVKSVE